MGKLTAGVGEAIERIKHGIDCRLNDVLCEMKPDYDDAITGFNEAWDVVRKYFKSDWIEALTSPAPPSPKLKELTMGKLTAADVDLIMSRVRMEIEDLMPNKNGVPEMSAAGAQVIDGLRITVGDAELPDPTTTPMNWRPVPRLGGLPRWSPRSPRSSASACTATGPAMASTSTSWPPSSARCWRSPMRCRSIAT